MSVVWFGRSVLVGWRSHQEAATWDGVSCCDPLDDIGVLHTILNVAVTVAAMSALVMLTRSRWMSMAVAGIYALMVVVLVQGETVGTSDLPIVAAAAIVVSALGGLVPGDVERAPPNERAPHISRVMVFIGLFWLMLVGVVLPLWV